MRGFERGVTSIFGSSNARMVKKLQSRVAAINELESRFQMLSDAELREQTAKFKTRLRKGETLDDILPKHLLCVGKEVVVFSACAITMCN